MNLEDTMSSPSGYMAEMQPWLPGLSAGLGDPEKGWDLFEDSQAGCGAHPFRLRIYPHTLYFPWESWRTRHRGWPFSLPTPQMKKKGSNIFYTEMRHSEELVPSTVLKTAHKFSWEFLHRSLLTPSLTLNYICFF